MDYDHSKDERFKGACEHLLRDFCWGETNECWLEWTEPGYRKMTFNQKGRKPHYIQMDPEGRITVGKNRVVGDEVILETTLGTIEKVDTQEPRKRIKAFK